MSKVPFKNGYRLTQGFGLRPEYYKQFGFNGHEGIDLVPAGNDATLYAIEDGVVARDIDDPKDGAYGIYVVLLNKDKRRAWWYCHMSTNNVAPGQVIKRGQAIGTYGNTGNTSGPHLHLNLRECDANGNAINTNNGFKGFVDPLPVLSTLADLSIGGSMPAGQSALPENYGEIIHGATQWDSTVRKYAPGETKPKDWSFDALQKVVSGIQGVATARENERNEALVKLEVATSENLNRKEQVSRLEKQLTEDAKAYETQIVQLKKQGDLNDPYVKGLESSAAQYKELYNLEAKEKGRVALELAEVKARLVIAESGKPSDVAKEATGVLSLLKDLIARLLQILPTKG